jgi:hypothetical protein
MGTRARVQATRHLVEKLGGTPGPLFGEILDREFYELVLRGAPEPFHAWVEALRDAWLAAPPAFVVIDAWQLYSVAHDLVHVMARVAAAEVETRLGLPLACLDYPVVPPTLAAQVPVGPSKVEVRLSSEQLERKLACAHAYPEIAGEIAEFTKAAGLETLATEALHEPPPLEYLAPEPGVIPEYERYGAERVASGTYATPLRWAHVQAIYASLVTRFKAVGKVPA